jgi:hypothetical protein
MDVIQSRGIIGSGRPAGGAPPVELVFCNPDLQWRNEFPRPRLGQGAFREAFQAVHQVCATFRFVSIRWAMTDVLTRSRRSRARPTRTYSSVSRRHTHTTLRRKCYVPEWQSFMARLSCPTSNRDCQYPFLSLEPEILY